MEMIDIDHNFIYISKGDISDHIFNSSLAGWMSISHFYDRHGDTAAPGIVWI